MLSVLSEVVTEHEAVVGEVRISEKALCEVLVTDRSGGEDVLLNEDGWVEVLGGR